MQKKKGFNWKRGLAGAAMMSGFAFGGYAMGASMDDVTLSFNGQVKYRSHVDSIDVGDFVGSHADSFLGHDVLVFSSDGIGDDVYSLNDGEKEMSILLSYMPIEKEYFGTYKQDGDMKIAKIDVTVDAKTDWFNNEYEILRKSVNTEMREVAQEIDMSLSYDRVLPTANYILPQITSSTRIDTANFDPS